ncbi:MAG: hypothetical protein Q9159_006166 [Coniocarpon cinnabarinum]
MALTAVEEQLRSSRLDEQSQSSSLSPQNPFIHHTSQRGVPTFRTKSLPASGAVLPPPPPSDLPLTTPVGDAWPRPYYLADGLRRVQPYHFTYNTYCKERWRGRALLEIFTDEFRDRPKEYYCDAISTGYITINGQAVGTDKVLKNGDVVSHTLHRHEPPVTADPIGVVHEDENMLVIDKPAGVPVHPAGRYNYNSLVEIVRAERGGSFNPMPCNRLDRLTSGIMFIGKTKVAAEKLGAEIKDRSVRKEYVARVVGEFPQGEVLCEQPILSISPKLGLNRVRAGGKDARTLFRRLAYYPPSSQQNCAVSEMNSTSHALPWMGKQGHSIVRCFPITGRTHQLRVHLQFLGHPITNDPIYCNQRVFGHTLGSGSSTDADDESVLDALEKMGKTEVADAVAYHDEMVDVYNKRKAEKQTGEKCDICDTPLYSDPGIHELGIYLHALRYAHADNSWDYQTPLPKWAVPPNGCEGPTEPTKETDPLTSRVAKFSMEEKTFEDSDKSTI